jgi:hypothetical protein
MLLGNPPNFNVLKTENAKREIFWGVQFLLMTTTAMTIAKTLKAASGSPIGLPTKFARPFQSVPD